MPEAKTKPTDASIEAYLNAIEDLERREDCSVLVKLMAEITGHSAVMWGPSIVGFGQYHYKYASGHEGDSCLTGFSSRKGDISIYTQIGFEGRAKLLSTLGKHKTGRACLYVRRLSDIDLSVLKELITSTVADLKKHTSMSVAK